MEKTRGKVGIVGLGGMGAGVAERLNNEGWDVVVWNRSKAAQTNFIARVGGTAADTPRDCAATGHVISFVANDAALTDVTTGADGILEGLPNDGVHISMSSVSPKIITDLTATHNGRLVAAPVFGRPEAAAKGLLWVALAGPDAASSQARSSLEYVSRSIHEFGTDPATALGVKIAGNFMIASAIEAMSEAFAMLEGTGADSAAFHEMMSDSIFGSIIHQNYGKIILDESFNPPGFKLALGGKDIGLAKDLAQTAGTPLPFGDILAERFDAAVKNGLGDADWNAISTLVRRS